MLLKVRYMNLFKIIHIKEQDLNIRSISILYYTYISQYFFDNLTKFSPSI